MINVRHYVFFLKKKTGIATEVLLGFHNSLMGILPKLKARHIVYFNAANF